MNCNAFAPREGSHLQLLFGALATPQKLSQISALSDTPIPLRYIITALPSIISVIRHAGNELWTMVSDGDQHVLTSCQTSSGIGIVNVGWDLTEPSGVTDYLRTTPFASKEVHRIQIGKTNYVYLLHLKCPLGDGKDSTAVLKYSGPGVASDSLVALPPERATFESRALQFIPWKTFDYASARSKFDGRLCSGVNMPKLYFHDPENHLSIMEDCTPRPAFERARQSTHSFTKFVETVRTTDKEKTASFVGNMLGSFLAQLQLWSWTRGAGREQSQDLFSANTAAKELIIKDTLTDLLRNVERTGYHALGKERERLLAHVMEQLDKSVRRDLECVGLGDFWYVCYENQTHVVEANGPNAPRIGNVLLGFDGSDNLESISVIDWDFVTMLPTYVDFGIFVGELYILDYFDSSNSTYLTILESFVEAYRSFGVPFSTASALRYAGAHILMSLSQLVLSSQSRFTSDIAMPCVEEVLDFIIDPEFKELNMRKDDALDNILLLMRERKRVM